MRLTLTIQKVIILATLLITFKAKIVPENGKTTIKVVPSGQMWFGQPQSTITIAASSEC